MARHEVEALWALVSGELDAEARARVEAHVAGCDSCAQRLAEVRESRALLRVAREQPPEVRWAEVDDRVLTMATQRFARLEHRPRWPWMLAAMGACAAVLALVLLRPGPTPRPVEETVVAQPAETTAPASTTQVEGEATASVLEADGAERTLQEGAGLKAGSAVRTPARGSTRLRLPDASLMQVSADSEVVLSRIAADDVHLRVTRGRIAVQASHAERRGFVVEADGLRVFVVGTVFSVERTPQGPAVSVLEGKVRVEAEDQPSSFATAGQRVELRASEHAWRRRPLSAQDQRAFEALGVRVKTASTARPPAPAPMPVKKPTPSQAPETDPRASAMRSALVPGAKNAVLPMPAPPSPAGEESTRAPEQAWPLLPVLRVVEERFLAHARSAVSTRLCESFQEGLGEIAEQSRVPASREEARYLRARCYQTRSAPTQAEAEYRLYLKEFPQGRWSEEARGALGP
ncbi:FecR domain-containing protein [Vitiosangium sp. GDMCC 1.1324]|uniref:FecR domain-containing protein n=1 Tax=Vitiosangium sp. (strain GDMCC 1.1324) TaxID=2138576 RepID=UPI000D34BF5D|nr:FecR domain-containing protein [Vitiosangium sp. GDMCC 1.1324]PTL77855.1 VgrG protein [Vitiosangium sp. GDMCC 1.1324]